MNKYPNLEQINRYYKLQNQVNRIILKNLKKGDVIYGQKSLNKQLPVHLRTHTSDVDLYSYTPRERALAIEKELDQAMQFDAYKIAKARYPKTTKIKSNVDSSTAVDITQKENHIPSVNILGVDYANLDYIRGQKERTIKSGIAPHRLLKDKSQRARILITQQKQFKPIKWEGKPLSW